MSRGIKETLTRIHPDYTNHQRKSIKTNNFHRGIAEQLLMIFLLKRLQFATYFLNVSHIYPVTRSKFHIHPCTVCFMSMSANSVLHDISWFMWEHMGYYWLPCIKNEVKSEALFKKETTKKV